MLDACGSGETLCLIKACALTSACRCLPPASPYPAAAVRLLVSRRSQHLQFPTGHFRLAPSYPFPLWLAPSYPSPLWLAPSSASPPWRENPSLKNGGGLAESPQWRNGPPAYPILCNACGTRFLRNHTLRKSTVSALTPLSPNVCVRPSPPLPR